MAAVKGRDAVKRYLAQLQVDLREKVLIGAARSAATVIADEAKLRSNSARVAAAVKIVTKGEDGRIISKVRVKMRGYQIGYWLEYGTDPHFISVDDSQRQGLSVSRFNEAPASGSLVINGNFVGKTILHPGARKQPFLRPALDTKEAEAVAAAQGYINSKIVRGAIAPGGREAEEE